MAKAEIIERGKEKYRTLWIVAVAKASEFMSDKDYKEYTEFIRAFEREIMGKGKK